MKFANSWDWNALDKQMHPPIKTFEDACGNDVTVRRAIESGASHEQLITILAEQKRLLMQRILALELIAPRKMKGSDGVTYVWRCPDELVPLSGSPEITES